MKGFVILFAVLLVSITLVIGLSIFNITFKQIVLSSVARDSQFAYFAADSALDCARHWDTYPREDNGDDTTDRPFGALICRGAGGGECSVPWTWIGPHINVIGCGGVDNVNLGRTSSTNFYQTKFTTVWNDGSGRATCAEVEVNQYLDEYVGPDGVEGQTIFRARGYNLYDENANPPCPAVSDRTVERALIFILDN